MPEKKVEIRVLEERIESLKDQLKLRSESIEKRMTIYVTGISSAFVILVSLLSFFGYKSIVNTVTKTTSDIIKPQAELALTDLIKGIREEGAKGIKKMFADLEKKMEKELKGTVKIENISPKVGKELGALVNVLIQAKPEKEYTSEEWYIKGMHEAFQKNYPAVITYMTKAIDLGSERVQAYFNRGYAYRKLEQIEEAIKDYDKVIKLDPAHAIAYLEKGVAYDSLRDHDKAIEDYKLALEFDPDYIIAILNISEHEIITGDYQSAMNRITNGLSLQTDTGSRATLLYLECIVKKILNLDTFDSEAAFNKILKNHFVLNWNFQKLESWLTKAKLERNTEGFIREKTETFKKYKR